MQDKSQLPFHAKRKKSESYQEQYIIGIGASAGGLEAINELFDNIPHGSGYSFVVVQHLSSNHKSLMDELLAKHTSITIVHAEEGMDVLPDRIYLIPNRKNMAIHGGKLNLMDKPVNNAPNYGIDIFFVSLAREKKEKAISIILSGTGTDGTRGVAEIKRYGGMVLVQGPATAKFDGMPNSAISAGYYDKSLPPEFMCEEIFNYVGKPVVRKPIISGDAEEIKTYLGGILDLVKEYTSFDFSSYKEQTLHRRLVKKMKQLEIDDLRSILYNLLSNALKYCSKDRKPFIKIKTADAGPYILLTFSDNGLGMNKSQVKKLFSMFKRFHPQVDGAGIGLYMVKRIVDNNAGKIEVESEEGKGTDFRIYSKKNYAQGLKEDVSNTAFA